ncbi:uncharacterized protein At1g24485-like [Macadamia integrifolia]|uniref:uncharacterized protein At1g24485-like n=1 Tax=Macadamia integrifolia TaxID=60698 RepID=UPI001C4F0766|nr:uncharacterized protein At1g24485-like [Macadamia integrifolia]
MPNIHLFFFLLSLHAIAASAQSGFVSIDCGSSSKDYTDGNGIIWSGDDPYIHTGENKVVQSSNTLSPVLNTLRVFSTRKKNCYSIPFTKGTHVLVRASFYYGNYDQNSSPPSFALHLDGNKWATVVTSSINWVFYEVIYVVRNEAISVCLAQTEPYQFPFISALEVRTLDSKMYPYLDFSNYALFLNERTDFGANQTLIRYPYDKYDRMWIAVGPGTGMTAVTSTAKVISTSGISDNPPYSALQNAVTTIDATETSIYFYPTLPIISTYVYMNFYFSEVDVLDSKTQLRSFNIDIDGLSKGDPIVPTYGSLTEMIFSNFTASSSDSFSLVSTNNSTLPPLINALEVFLISNPLTSGTNSVDVKQLSLLQTQFPVLAEWSGDPCLPEFYSWEWVGCSSDATPRVIDLYLSGYGLSGTIPDFSSMDALQTIDLQNNSLTGEIPASLGSLTNLQLLVSGNQKLCTSSCGSSVPPSSPGTPSDVPSSSGGTPSDTSSTTPSTSTSGKSSSKLPIILGITIPAFVVFLVIVAFVAITYHKGKTAATAARNEGFVSLNCSSSSNSYTNTMGITWYSDDSYIYIGEKKGVVTTKTFSQAMNTLRVFSTRKNTCYSIPFIKDTKVLVLASFFYGNYDQKSSPPSCDLQFDGNNWLTVQASVVI